MTMNNCDEHVQGIEGIEDKIVKGDALRSISDQVEDVSATYPQNEGYQSECRE